MKTFLALDTATDLGSVAVGSPGECTVELRISKRRHAAQLMPKIREALALANKAFTDLSGIVVADGPGSFTGLRIGFSTAMGILRDHPSIALHTAPSLLCAAHGAFDGREATIAALYDALRGDVYGAVYRFEGRLLERVLDPLLCTIDDLRRRCTATPQICVGDGAVLHREAVMAWTGRDPVEIGGHKQNAASLLELLAVDGATNVVDPSSFEPDYGRLAEAQVRLESSEKNPNIPKAEGDVA